MQDRDVNDNPFDYDLWTDGTTEVNMQDVKLKPCPFCGGKAAAWESTFCVWKVFCTECGANITLNKDENADVLWNKRVGEVAE